MKKLVFSSLVCIGTTLTPMAYAAEGVSLFGNFISANAMAPVCQLVARGLHSAWVTAVGASCEGVGAMLSNTPSRRMSAWNNAAATWSRMIAKNAKAR